MQLIENLRLTIAALQVVETKVLVAVHEMLQKAICCCLLGFPFSFPKVFCFQVQTDRDIFTRDDRIYEALSNFQVGARVFQKPNFPFSAAFQNAFRSFHIKEEILQKI